MTPTPARRSARRRASRSIVALAVLSLLTPLVADQSVTFRSQATLVRVDVVVRDRSGTIVKGLSAGDFLVTEDGRTQQITSFDFEEISVSALPPLDAAVPGVLGLEQLQAAAERTSVTVAPARPGGVAEPAESPRRPDGATDDAFAGRRLVVLLFDTSSMQPEEVDRAVKAAAKYVETQMSTTDLVAVAAVGQSLTILRDFTADRDLLLATLAAFDATAGTGFEQPEVADPSAVTEDTDPADLPLDDSEFGIFNNDRRLRAMRVLADALAAIDQKKAILYFSSGMSRSGSDNQVELRAVINAAVRANTSIYPVDTRGLTAVVPGGAAGRGGGGRGGASVFSGRAMLSQFSSLNASQETLTTLAEDTGGEAFIDTNDFAPAFTRVQNDMSAYYLLGYSSANVAKDGKFRRISVRLRNATLGYRLEARSGYYAEADFAHLRKEDKEQQLREQIASAVSSTDIPVVATTSWFRLANGRFYVPVSVALPGSMVRVPTDPKLDRRNASVDLLGVVTDEQGRAVGRIRDTMQIPAAQVATLENRQLQYQAGVTLPAGRFKVKVAVRENADGAMGTFEFPITIPDLAAQPLKVSPVVLSTQLRSMRGAGPGPGGRGGGGLGAPPPPGPGFTSQRGGGGPQWSNTGSTNPLLRNGQEIVQSLSHIVLGGQQMYFYYEVYEPALDRAGLPRVRTSLAFYRGRVKVFETPVVDRAAIDEADRKAVVFQLQVPASGLRPGLYTCQVNVIDEISGRFAFPRVAVYVKEAAPAPASPSGAASSAGSPAGASPQMPVGAGAGPPAR